MLRNNYSGLWKKKFLPEKIFCRKKISEKKNFRRWPASWKEGEAEN